MGGAAGLQFPESTGIVDNLFQVAVFCKCGWLLKLSANGYYCENHKCDLRTKLFDVTVFVQEAPIPCANFA